MRPRLAVLESPERITCTPPLVSVTRQRGPSASAAWLERRSAGTRQYLIIFMGKFPIVMRPQNTGRTMCYVRT
jgi:hypothetical protein